MTPRRIESLTLDGAAGRIEALLEAPEQAPREVAVVCHPHPLYGGTMHNKVVFRIARALRRSGTVVLRFNFRGVGRSEGEHAHGAGELEDARLLLEWLRAKYPGLPYAVAGFSFGSRIALKLGCSTEGVRRAIAVGFPVEGDWDYLSRCEVPKIFVQSTGDHLAPRAEFEERYASVSEPKRLFWIGAADHFFADALDALEGELYQLSA